MQRSKVSTIESENETDCVARQAKYGSECSINPICGTAAPLLFLVSALLKQSNRSIYSIQCCVEWLRKSFTIRVRGPGSE